jgi:hypothetical protein
LAKLSATILDLLSRPYDEFTMDKLMNHEMPNLYEEYTREAMAIKRFVDRIGKVE